MGAGEPGFGGWSYPSDPADLGRCLRLLREIPEWAPRMPEMAKRGGGSIVVTASTAGVRGSVGLSAYVASKHAAVGLMRTAALEGAKHKIRVNSVNPSPIETAMVHELEEGLSPGTPAQGKQLLTSRSPLGRYGTPDEVADLMLFLASDDSRFITGGVHMIDGGRTAS